MNIKSILSNKLLPWGIILFLLIYLFTCNHKSLPPAPKIIAPAVVTKMIEQPLAVTNAKVDSLQKIADTARRNEINYSTKYAVAKSTVNMLLKELGKYSKAPDKTNDNNLDNKRPNDYAGSGCDSALVADLIASNMEKDDFADSLRAQLDIQVAAKDSQINKLKAEIDTLHKVAVLSNNQTKKVVDYSKAVKKDDRKKGVGNFLLKAVVIGEAAYIIIKSIH